MRKGKRRRKGPRQHAIYGLAVLLFGASLPITALTHAAIPDDSNTPPAWANPSTITIRQTGFVSSNQTEPNYLNNLDCQLATYRLTNDNSEQSGCFSEAAFGLVDTDNDQAIFNGTDEAVQLLPYSPHEVLVPWPGTIDVLALDATNTGGSYVHLYRNALDAFQDERNALGQLTAKQLTRPPETQLRDPSGQLLAINPQTMAFSSGSSWLVVEDLGGSFVRINLATLDMLPFAPSLGMLGSPGLLKSRVAVSDSGQYVTIENDAASTFKVYDLATCTGSGSNLQPESCRTYDYWPYARQHIGGLQAVRHVRFLNDGLLSFEAIANGSDTGTFLLAPTGSITSLTDYIGLGDSYTSGEGTFDYIGNTDTTDNRCHLSARSYPLLLTRDLFSATGGHSVACSGAVINDIGSENDEYRGQVKGVPSLKQLRSSEPELLASVETNFLPGYIAQHRFVSQYQPAITTVSVGGDDIGFGDILIRCVAPHLRAHLSDQNCFNTYEDRLELLQEIDRTAPRWVALYKHLQSESPGTRIYALGYPEIADDTGNCALNVHLSKEELEFSDELIVYLNKAIAEAAAKAGVTYVNIGKALAGHRLCEAPSYDIAMNGLTAGTDAGPLGIKILGKESYHPNALGQTLIEQTILRQTHNLTVASGDSTDSSGSGQNLLNAPKTGRKVNVRVAGSNLTSAAVRRGTFATLNVDGTKYGLKPGAPYTIRLDGSTGPAVATTTTNTSGNISTDISIPATTEPGGHTIDITGENQADEAIDVTGTVYVAGDGNDADDDNLADADDSCPGANSGEDADHDGIDDACDGFIGPSTADGNHDNRGPDASVGSSTPSFQGTGDNAGNNLQRVGNEMGEGQQTVSTGQMQPATNISVLNGVRIAGIAQSAQSATGQISVSDARLSTALHVVHSSSRSNTLLQASQSFQPKLPPVPGKPQNNTIKEVNPTVIGWLPWLLIPFISLFLLLFISLCLSLLMKRFEHQTAYA